MKVSNLLRHSGVLFGGFLALTVLAIMNSAYSYVLGSIKGELALSYTESGALMSAYFTGYMVGQIPWGFLADRFGSRRVMAASVLGVSTSTVLFGLSTGFFSLAGKVLQNVTHVIHLVAGGQGALPEEGQQHHPGLQLLCDGDSVGDPLLP